MLLRLICLFTLIPLIELAILWKLTSLKIAILIVIGTGILGAVLARRQGMRWRETMARQLQRGEMPADGIFDGLLIFLAGALLVTPGVLTDVVGFGLLVPPFRDWVKNRIRRKIAVSFGLPDDFGSSSTTKQTGETFGRDVVIDSYVVENSPEQITKKQP